MAYKVHEIVGIFTTFDDMQKAIAELETSAFNRLDISVLGSEKTLHKIFGNHRPDTKHLEDDASTPRSPNIATEELSVAQGVLVGGGLLAGIAAVVVASGGVIAAGIPVALILGGASGAAVGGFLAKMLGDKYAEFFQQQVEGGGLLLWVRTNSETKEKQAKEIYNKHGAHDVHVHTIG